MLNFRLIALTLFGAMILSACTIYLAPTNVEPQIIARFAPERGAGSSYPSGQPISFNLASERSGYVSLAVTDPDGRSYVLASNLPVAPGSNRLAGVGRTTRFVVVPPVGLHRVRAYFSETAVPEGDEATIRRFALEIAETHFYVTRR